MMVKNENVIFSEHFWNKDEVIKQSNSYLIFGIKLKLNLSHGSLGMDLKNTHTISA